MLVDIERETSRPIRLVIIDNHTLVRRGLVAFMNTNPDIELVGEGTNGQESLELCAEVNPDVVLIDLMPVADSITATRDITNLYPDTKVLVMTGFTDQKLIKDVIKDVLEAGATGYLLKKISGKALVNAIHAAHHGVSTYSPEVIDMLAKSVYKRTRTRPVLRAEQ